MLRTAVIALISTVAMAQPEGMAQEGQKHMENPEMAQVKREPKMDQKLAQSKKFGPHPQHLAQGGHKQKRPEGKKMAQGEKKQHPEHLAQGEHKQRRPEGQKMAQHERPHGEKLAQGERRHPEHLAQGQHKQRRPEGQKMAQHQHKQREGPAGPEGMAQQPPMGRPGPNAEKLAEEAVVEEAVVEETV